MIWLMKSQNKGFMIRTCTETDGPAILDIVNDAAQAYQGVIPQSHWRVPYMSLGQLTSEIGNGVVFSGAREKDGSLIGVMGIQAKGDVYLIRHAYVRTAARRSGIGSALLTYLTEAADKPFLVGTWRSATWAISFYERHGFRNIGPTETLRLLRTYWSISARQADASVVLADERWHSH